MSAENSLFPWHSDVWASLQQRRLQQRLPHALLLTGAVGMGKMQFSQQVAHSLLCNQPTADGFACQHCPACRLLHSGNHPDLLQIKPSEAGKAIQVDQIREMIKFCALTSSYGRYQVVIISPAEAMNHNAANSLLKILEEPNANTLIMLISHRPMGLLATVRSRCQKLDFNRTDKHLMQNWLNQKLQTLKQNQYSAELLLALTHQAPLAALALLEENIIQKRKTLFDSLPTLLEGQIDPLKIAEQWQTLDGVQVIQWLQSWTMDMIRFLMTQQLTVIINQDYQAFIQKISTRFELKHLFQLLEQQQENYRLLTTGANIKAQHLLELLALQFVEHLKHR